MKIAAVFALTVISGLGSQYRPGLMPEVVDNRQQHRTLYDLPTPLPSDTIPVAWPFCGDIGQRIELSIEGAPWQQAIIADCPHSDEVQAWMIDNSILVELSGETAAEYGVVGRMVSIRRRITATRDKRWPLPKGAK